MQTTYIFKSERLGFRNWKIDDLNEFAKINADPEVMQHFPTSLSQDETADYIDRLRKHYDQNGFNYFATEILDNQELIGFIGLALQNYPTDFTPAVDIGWRLKKSAWGKGYATEGALQCLEYGFNHLGLEKIIATCTIQNHKSEHVMKKIGMQKIREFNHPKLKEHPHLEKCVLFALNKESWTKK